METYIRHQCDSHDSDINVHNHTGGVDIGPSPPRPPVENRIIRENDGDGCGVDDAR